MGGRFVARGYLDRVVQEVRVAHRVIPGVEKQRPGLPKPGKEATSGKTLLATPYPPHKRVRQFNCRL